MAKKQNTSSAQRNIVVMGKKNWLFLNQGNNEFMSYVSGKKQLSAQTIDYWKKTLQRRKDWFAERNIKYVHVFAPEKVTVYPEFFYTKVNIDNGHIAVLAKACGSLFLNVIPYFNQVKQKHQLYDKTDTHWNYQGAAACYQLICSVLKYDFNMKIFTGERKALDTVCDLGNKLIPPRRETISVPKAPEGYQRQFANLLVRYKEKHRIENEAGLHVGSRVIFRNENAPYAEKVIIFGDSFAEYRRYRLTSMFAETFKEVHFCWSSNIDYAYVEREQPTIVISELAERFAINAPDDMNFKADAFARKRLKEYLMSQRS
jgi:hypothetical protein